MSKNSEKRQKCRKTIKNLKKLEKNLQNLDLPPGILAWLTNFLTNRQQRVKLSNNIFSDWAMVSAGVPQGTKL